MTDANTEIAQLTSQLETEAAEGASLQGQLEEAITDGDAAKGKLKAERENTALLEAARAAGVKVRSTAHTDPTHNPKMGRPSCGQV